MIVGKPSKFKMKNFLIEPFMELARVPAYSENLISKGTKVSIYHFYTHTHYKSGKKEYRATIILLFASLETIIDI